MNSFNSKAAAEAAGISYRQLDYWDRSGVVRPDVSVAHGSGSRRWYSARAVMRLRMAKRLSDMGVTLEVMRDNKLNEMEFEIPTAVVVVNGKIMQTSLPKDAENVQDYVCIAATESLKEGLPE